VQKEQSPRRQRRAIEYRPDSTIVIFIPGEPQNSSCKPLGLGAARAREAASQATLSRSQINFRIAPVRLLLMHPATRPPSV
jgi:hypothetical protein